MTNFMKLSSTANILAGIFLLAFWYLYAALLPYKELENTLSILVLDSQWVFINILGVSGSLLGTIGLIGIYIKAADEISTFGMIGFILAFLGTILFTTPIIWDTIIWPILANHDSSLLDFQGPIYMSKTFVPFFVISGMIYSVGYVLLGIALARSGVFPYWGSIMIAVGAPLFGLGAMLGKMQVYPRTIGITLFATGLIWIGKFLYR